jgi:quercetin dioxygenase-like cupin family protein
VADDPEGLVAIGVLFEPGARTDWHHHPGGQTLYVASGAGVVSNEAGETVAVSAGDVVSIPPGETHWHGAGPGSYMMHLSLTTGGPTAWIGEKVGDEDYGGALESG